MAVAGSVLRAAAARVVRNRRTVLLTYPGLRLGNILYFALHAHLQQAAGRDFRVVDPAPAERWPDRMPGLRPLLVDSASVRRTDRREHIPPSFFQHFGVDFTAGQLASFVRAKLLDALPIELAPDSEADVVVNVRRGDYYSAPHFRALFGYDIVDYTRRALRALEEQSGPARAVRVVSDDPGWCRANLGFLADGGRTISWSDPSAGALDNLYTVAAGRRLIISNSTFSYWGAYVSNVLHGDNHHEVWVPDLHSRGVRAGVPWQHDQVWNRLDVQPL